MKQLTKQQTDMSVSVPKPILDLKQPGVQHFDSFNENEEPSTKLFVSRNPCVSVICTAATLPFTTMLLINCPGCSLRVNAAIAPRMVLPIITDPVDVVN